ncbi:hypothetical protein HUT13_19850 [Streptomyces harbinensis]|uniref:hypothetical protein n=1 Tax=Streptomyces harbinensis TaxID=1176198 RepID=UPI001591D6D3|nr:hypothetical protein [Streptomyces harbinensis]QKV70768.1 hypothetical protein HUT13_19850 [Streptomyces harbinensis]
MDFEDLEFATHEQLAALLNGANPDALIGRGETLINAARAVAQVGAVVAHQMRVLEWEGETATVLREWAARFESDSEHLKMYTNTIGLAMRTSGAALKEAISSMPPVPETAPVPDSGSQQAFGTYLGAGALSGNEQVRQEAIGVISRLGQAYTAASTVIRALPEPHFTPLDPGPDPWSLPATDGSSSPGSGGQPAAGSYRAPWSGERYTSQELPGHGGNATHPVATGGFRPSVPSGAVVDGGVGTSLDSVGTLPNSAPPSAPPPPVVERPVMPGGGGPVQQPVVGPVPGWPAPGNPGPGQGPGRGGGSGQLPPGRGPVRPGETPAGGGRVPAGPSNVPGGQQPPVGRPPYNPGTPVGQQNPLGRPSATGPGGANPWGKANNYGLLGGRPGSNAKPTVASRIPPGGVIQPGMNPTNSRLTPTTRKAEQPDQPRGAYGKATVDGRTPGNRRRGLPKPTGVIGLPGQTRRTKKSRSKKKRNESKDDRQS